MNDFNNLAPIVLFVYNRPNHLRQTVQSLQKNKLVKASELFIYSDAPKNEQAVKYVNEVRDYIKTINGFKNVTIIERKKNWGLANNIIDGVTTIVCKYGTIIMLEDDLVLSPYYLMYMNKALDYYREKKKVWHISGWNLPIDRTGLPDTFLVRVMNCSGGWATWSDRWQYFERNFSKIVSGFSKEDIYHFNLEGSKKFWKQVKDNINGNLSTWAIFWYATIFKNQGLCLNPSHSYVKNIGHDCSGIHCLDGDYKDNLSISQKPSITFVEKIEESSLAVEKIIDFYNSNKKSLLVRTIKKLKRITADYNENPHR